MYADRRFPKAWEVTVLTIYLTAQEGCCSNAQMLFNAQKKQD